MNRPVVNELHLWQPADEGSAGLAERQRIQQLREGSQEAFDWLVHSYADSVYRLAYRLLNEPADAPDVAQEVFLKVFRTIGQFQGECSLRTWIYRITVNTASNQNRWWRRHRGLESTIEETEPDGNEHPLPASEAPSPLHLLLSSERQALVQEALLRLGEQQRMVLVLREMEDLSYEEMADILHVSMGTVKSRIARARQALKHELEALMEKDCRALPALSPAKQV